MFRPGPLTNIACSKLGIGKTLGEAADSVEIIEAETVEPAAPLIVLPGMLDRVTNGVVGHSTMQEEVDAATTTLFKHAPVVKYTLFRLSRSSLGSRVSWWLCSKDRGGQGSFPIGSGRARRRSLLLYVPRQPYIFWTLAD